MPAPHPGLAPLFERIEREDALTLEDQRRLTEIPAPLLGEAARGRAVAATLRQLGLHVGVDAAGNVLASRTEGDVASAILLAAHLDTVFPPDTDVRVRTDGERLLAPGISDNGRGLAALLRLAALHAELPPLRHPIVFAFTVGEEGAGDLRGVKHLFAEGRYRDAAAFIAVDGAGLPRIVHRSVGSRRLRVEVSGPGGHSWQDRGSPNPLHALSAAVAALAAEPVTRGDDVALNVGRMGGGTSVNAIPERAWLELDLRSEDAARVTALEAAARTALQQHVQLPLELRVDVMGDRPAGTLAAEHPLVRAACLATEHFGERPALTSSSTDANVPMSLGIPAIAIGAGGRAGGMHTLQEWYENERGKVGIQRLLLALGLADSLL